MQTFALKSHAARSFNGPNSPAQTHRQTPAVRTILRGPRIQPKLTIGAVNDPAEHEADRVADQVTRMPDRDIGARESSTPAVGRPLPAAGLQRMCAECEKEHGATLQRRADGADAPNTAPPSVHQVLRSPGRPLDTATRAFMEPRFGQDFSQVRVHTGANAEASARDVNARAYTVGRDVVFGSGAYATHTEAGRSLIAHELTHTIQQTGSTAGPRLQRTIGDGHDLTAPRFALDAVLEAVYDDERLLKSGNSGPEIEKLQQALIDASFDLPKHGVDGKFGPETKAAVKKFQHASGLTGKAVDGIVGPITMGWLDQRFSTGPTPAGTQPGATPGCAAFKTVNVDLVSLDGSTRNPLTELERTNTIFNQCCVRFVFGGGGTEGPVRTAELLGGDTDLDFSPVCGAATAEETSLLDGATDDFGLSSRFRVFYVESIDAGTLAFSNPPFCSTGPRAALLEMAAVSNIASERGLAHELAHMLLDSGAHPADSDNLMSAAATPPGEQLTAAQCATIFTNA